MKKCTKCFKSKELSEFGRYKKSKSGLEYRCKLCRSANSQSQRSNFTTEQREKYNDMARSRWKKRGILYSVWHSMKARCCNANNKRYKDYGGRGISVCSEWINSPKVFESWALANGHKQGLQIDRTNNDGNYEPSNCRFVTLSVNLANRRISK